MVTALLSAAHVESVAASPIGSMVFVTGFVSHGTNAKDYITLAYAA